MSEVKVTPSPIEHADNEAALTRFTSRLNEAQKEGRWMAAVWVVREGRIELLNRTTFDFPGDDLLVASSQLVVECLDERERVKAKSPPFPPLPSALGVVRPDDQAEPGSLDEANADLADAGALTANDYRCNGETPPEEPLL